MIAVKRDQRDNVPEAWHEIVSEIDGLKILSPVNRPRLVVDGDEKAITRLEQALSHWCHIEPWIEHDTR